MDTSEITVLTAKMNINDTVIKANMKTIDITVIKYIMENIMNIRVITDIKSSMNIKDIYSTVKML
jgi:hypothetical protein